MVGLEDIIELLPSKLCTNSGISVSRIRHCLWSLNRFTTFFFASIIIWLNLFVWWLLSSINGICGFNSLIGFVDMTGGLSV